MKKLTVSLLLTGLLVCIFSGCSAKMHPLPTWKPAEETAAVSTEMPPEDTAIESAAEPVANTDATEQPAASDFRALEEQGKITIYPIRAYWNDVGELVLESYIINGMDQAVTDIQLTELQLSLLTPTTQTDNSGRKATLLASGSFGAIQNKDGTSPVIAAHDGVNWNFTFGWDCIVCENIEFHEGMAFATRCSYSYQAT